MSGQNEISDGAYVGSMQSGRYDGLGVYKYPDGTRYEGNFKNGLFHGTGKFVFANGVYEGTFKNGKVGCNLIQPPNPQFLSPQATV